MRVLLVNPKNQYNAGSNEVWTRFPLGLLYVAAGSLDHDVKIVDLNMDQIDLAEVIRDFGPDEIGISCWMDNFLSTEKIIATVKSTCNAKIVAGGPFATVTPETYLNLGVDEVHKGATFFPDYTELIAAYKKHFSPARMERYIGGSSRFPEHRVAMVAASYACPHNCSFCSSKYLCGYKEREFAEVEQEIAFLKEEYGINTLFFTDASFTLNRKRALAICKITKKLDVSWYAEARVDEIDQELVAIMADSGCVQLLIGVESFDQSALDGASKRTTRDQNLAAIKMIKAAGIDLAVFILFGLPGQTKAQIDESIREVERLKTFVIPNILFPIPGTKVWQIAKEKGLAPDPADLARRVSSRYDAAGRAFPVINLTQVSDETLVKAVQRINHLNNLLSKKDES